MEELQEIKFTNPTKVPDMLGQFTARNKHFCNTDIIIRNKDDLKNIYIYIRSCLQMIINFQLAIKLYYHFIILSKKKKSR